MVHTPSRLSLYYWWRPSLQKVTSFVDSPLLYSFFFLFLRPTCHLKTSPSINFISVTLTYNCLARNVDLNEPRNVNCTWKLLWRRPFGRLASASPLEPHSESRLRWDTPPNHIRLRTPGLWCRLQSGSGLTIAICTQSRALESFPRPGKIKTRNTTYESFVQPWTCHIRRILGNGPSNLKVKILILSLYVSALKNRLFRVKIIETFENRGDEEVWPSGLRLQTAILVILDCVSSLYQN